MLELTQQQLKEIVACTPLVSIDLLVRNAAGKILLGLRKNHPAKDFWFVPGRRIRKGVTLEEALIQTCIKELNFSPDPAALHPKGTFDHIYPEIFTGESDGGTQYVVLLFELDAEIDVAQLPRDQHSEYKWMAVDELLSSDRVHPNVKKFFSAGLIDTKQLLSLYPVYQEAISYYTNIVWAFPAAFVAMNAFVMQALRCEPIPLFFAALFNLLLVQAFFKLVANQTAIVDVLKKVESLLRCRLDPSVIPDFKAHYNKFTHMKSATLLKWALFVFALLYLFWVVMRLLPLFGVHWGPW